MLRRSAGAAVEAYSCPLLHGYLGMLLLVSITASPDNVVTAKLVRPFVYITTVELFASFYDLRLLELPCVVASAPLTLDNMTPVTVGDERVWKVLAPWEPTRAPGAPMVKDAELPVDDVDAGDDEYDDSEEAR